MAVELGNHVHSKTGNIYQVNGTVYPTKHPLDPMDIVTNFTALCCDNKEVEVTFYLVDTKYFYVTSENEGLSDNTSAKVLYTRDNVNWLRSEQDFRKLVDIKGEIKPRFVKVV
jgi:hypothetical protein